MRRNQLGWLLFSGMTAAFLTFACSGDDDATPSGTAGSGGTTADGSIASEAGTLHGLAVVNPTCGTGDGGTGDECVSCVSGSCASQLAACFDDAWQSSLVGGVCTDFGQCVTDCGCGDGACFQACVDAIEQNPADACYGCLAQLFACEQSSCGDACAEPEDDAGVEGGAEDGGQQDSGGGGNDGGKPDH